MTNGVDTRFGWSDFDVTSERTTTFSVHLQSVIDVMQHTNGNERTIAELWTIVMEERKSHLSYSE